MRVRSGNTGRDSSGQGAVHLPGRRHAQAACSEHGGGWGVGFTLAGAHATNPSTSVDYSVHRYCCSLIKLIR